MASVEGGILLGNDLAENYVKVGTLEAGSDRREQLTSGGC